MGSTLLLELHADASDVYLTWHQFGPAAPDAPRRVVDMAGFTAHLFTSISMKPPARSASSSVQRTSIRP